MGNSNYQKDEDTEIDLRQLFLMLLAHWRAWLLCVLLGASVGCGLRYWYLQGHMQAHNTAEQTEYDAAYSNYVVQYEELNNQIESAKTALDSGKANDGTKLSSTDRQTLVDSISKSSTSLSNLKEPEAPEIWTYSHEMVKYGCIGALVSWVACWMILSLNYTMGSKVSDDEYLTNAYGIPLIAAEPVKPISKHPTHFDKWVAKKRSSTAAVQHDEIKTIGALLIGVTAYKPFALISSSTSSSLLLEGSQLVDYLHGQGMKDMVTVMPKFLDNINKDTHKLEDYGNSVVLVEEKGKSKIADIDRTINLLQLLRCKIIGYIML